MYNAAKSLKEHQIKTALKIPFYKTNKNWNSLCNFGDIMALEGKYDAKSSFYFLTLNKGDLDFNFKVDDLEHEIGNIADKGWEVGLHKLSSSIRIFYRGSSKNAVAEADITNLK